jgi:hypothetical protein
VCQASLPRARCDKNTTRRKWRINFSPNH